MCHQFVRECANAILLCGADLGALCVAKRVGILVQNALDAVERDVFAIECVKQSVGDLKEKKEEVSVDLAKE